MRRQSHCCAALLGLLLVLPGGTILPAADPVAAEPDYLKIIEESAQKYQLAFNERDAVALSTLFTPEAEYVDASGLIFHGRRAIGAEFASTFELASAGKVTIRLVSIRPISKGVIVEDGISVFQPEEGSTSLTRYTATHVEQSDGQWLIASVRELASGIMTPHDRLQALSWLIGNWHEDIRGATISSNWEWAASGNYLVGSFTVKTPGGEIWEGTHRIGWDEERKQFHSWIFEANGGSMEGWWRPIEDGTWSVDLNGIDVAGIRRASVLNYQTDGPHAIVVSETQRILGGQSFPSRSSRIVRQPPEVPKKN